VTGDANLGQQAMRDRGRGDAATGSGRTGRGDVKTGIGRRRLRVQGGRSSA
jgi:hypothetical protein